MRPGPLPLAIGAGLVLALLLAPLTGTALGTLAAARAEQARMAQSVAAVSAGTAMLISPALRGDPAAIVAGVRDRAKASGVLVEAAEAVPGEGPLMLVRLRVSGSEKAVFALADGLERDAPLLRFRSWKLAAIPDGVRLSAEALAVQR